MNTWRPSMSGFLDELLRHEGLEDNRNNPKCGTCGVFYAKESPVRLLRCRDCIHYLECAGCCLKRHQAMPLHLVQVSFLTGRLMAETKDSE